MNQEMKLGTEVIINGLTYVAVDIVPPFLYLWRVNDGTLLIENLSKHADGGERIIASMMESTGRVKPQPEVFDSLPDKIQREVSKRLSIVQPMLDLFVATGKREMQGFADKYPRIIPPSTNINMLTTTTVRSMVARYYGVSPSTVQRYTRTFMEYGWKGLIPKPRTTKRSRRCKVVYITHPLNMKGKVNRNTDFEEEQVKHSNLLGRENAAQNPENTAPLDENDANKANQATEEPKLLWVYDHTTGRFKWVYK